MAVVCSWILAQPFPEKHTTAGVVNLTTAVRAMAWCSERRRLWSTSSSGEASAAISSPV